MVTHKPVRIVCNLYYSSCLLWKCFWVGVLTGIGLRRLFVLPVLTRTLYCFVCILYILSSIIIILAIILQSYHNHATIILQPCHNHTILSRLPRPKVHNSMFFNVWERFFEICENYNILVGMYLQKCVATFTHEECIMYHIIYLIH